MTSYGYIIMIIVDSWMIWFHFDCIMQLKKSYHIATNVCSRKSATTFGDLPDWLKARIIDPLWGESIGHGWIPQQMVNGAETLMTMFRFWSFSKS